MRRSFRTLARFGILRLNGIATRGLSALARQARKLEISIDGIDSFAAAPLTDIPVPSVNLATQDDPLPVIFQDPLHRDTVAYFARHASPTRSLLSIEAQ